MEITYDHRVLSRIKVVSFVGGRDKEQNSTRKVNYTNKQFRM